MKKKSIFSILFIIIILTINSFMYNKVDATGTCYIMSFVNQNFVAKDDVVTMAIVASGNKDVEMKEIIFDVNFDESKLEVLDIIQKKNGWNYNIKNEKGTINCESKSELEDNIIKDQEDILVIVFRAKHKGKASLNIENVKLGLKDGSNIESEKCIQNINIVKNKDEAKKNDSSISYKGAQIDVSKYKKDNKKRIIISIIIITIILIIIILAIRLKMKSKK